MSTTLRIVSSQPDTFEKVRHVQGGALEVYPCKEWDAATCHARDDVGLRRRRPGMGHVLNEGPHPIQVVYEHDGQRVGPTTDYLMPGTFKELGIGPGVTWWFREVSA